MRKFAFSYPLLLLGIWSGVLLAGDYVVLETSARQILARSFARTEGEIMRCELGRGAFSSRGLAIAYSYTVNGLDYTGHRYRYDDRNGAFDYKAVTKAFPPGSRRTVYYNAANPADSVLVPGLSGCDLLLALFTIPLNVLTFAAWSDLLRSRRERSRVPAAGGVKILQHKGETRVRLAALSPVAYGFFGLAATSALTAMLVVLIEGFAPSVRLMSDVLILAVISGFTVFAWRARKFQLGLYDVRLQKSSQTLVLPASAGQGEGLRVPLSEIVAVSMHRLVRHRPSGRHLSYVPSLDRAVPGGPPQPMRLAEWGWTEPEARTLAGWFSEELGVPFKGVEEETEATSSLAHR